MDFQILKETQKNIKQSENKNENFNKIMSEAIYLIDQFYQNNSLDKSYLEKATDKLINCTDLRPSNHESYVHLAFIAYLFDNLNLTNKYLSIASELSRDSELIKSFREQLLLSQNTNIKINKTIDSEQSHITEIVENNSKINIKRVQRL